MTNRETQHPRSGKELLQWHESLFVTVADIYGFLMREIPEDGISIEALSNGLLISLIDGDFERFRYRFLQEYEKHGVIEIKDGNIEITADGRLLEQELNKKFAQGNN
jgi:hypothetical protein